MTGSQPLYLCILPLFFCLYYVIGREIGNFNLCPMSLKWSLIFQTPQVHCFSIPSTSDQNVLNPFKGCGFLRVPGLCGEM